MSAAINNRNIPELTSLRECREFLDISIESDIPVLLIGPPGIGKTALIEEFDSNKYVASVEDTSFLDVPDINGILIPNMETNESSFTMPNIIRACNQLKSENPDKDVILFFDDITNSDLEVATGLFRLIQKRCIGQYCLPEGTKIICAGNDIDTSRSAKELPFPLLNRMSVAKYNGPTKYEWVEYARDNNFDESIITVINKEPDFLNSLMSANYDTGGHFQAATPRSWESASILLQRVKSKEGVYKTSFIKKIISSQIGSSVADHVIEIIELYGYIHDFDKITSSNNLQVDFNIDGKRRDLYYLQTEIVTSGLYREIKNHGDDIITSEKSFNEFFTKYQDCLNFMLENKFPYDYISYMFIDLVNYNMDLFRKAYASNIQIFMQLFKEYPDLQDYIKKCASKGKH